MRNAVAHIIALCVALAAARALFPMPWRYVCAWVIIFELIYHPLRALLRRRTPAG